MYLFNNRRGGVFVYEILDNLFLNITLDSRKILGKKYKKFT